MAVAPFAAMEAHGHRYELTHADGIAYLDLSDAVRDGRWEDLPNAHWSPLYPVLLALARSAAPSLESELPVVHALQVVLFLAALASLSFYASALRRVRWGVPADAEPGEGLARAPLAALAVAAGAVLLLDTIGLARVTPDLLLASFVFLSAGLALRILAEPARLRHALGFGLVAGAGYLAKAFLLPMALVWLACTWWALRRARRPRRGILVAALAFALVALPWIGILSAKVGHATFSDSGRLSVLFMQDGMPWVNWQGGTGPKGRPVHAPRKVSADPEVYEFAGPVPGTYPLWDDPAYWTEGAVAQPTLSGTARVAALSAWSLSKVLLQHAGLAVVVIALCALARGVRPPSKDLGVRWPALLPPLIALGAYVVAWLEPRYVGAFLALLAVTALDTVRMPADAPWRPAAVALVATGLALCGVVCAYDAAAEVREAFAPTATPMHLTAREAVGTLGEEGRVEPVAIVETSRPFPEGLYWVRYLRARVVAMVSSPRGVDEWAQRPGAVEAVRGALRRAGVRRLFSAERPQGPAGAPWRAVGRSGLYVLSVE